MTICGGQRDAPRTTIPKTNFRRDAGPSTALAGYAALVDGRPDDRVLMLWACKACFRLWAVAGIPVPHWLRNVTSRRCAPNLELRTEPHGRLETMSRADE
jgi:hypothetical protein